MGESVGAGLGKTCALLHATARRNTYRHWCERRARQDLRPAAGGRFLPARTGCGARLQARGCAACRG